MTVRPRVLTLPKGYRAADTLRFHGRDAQSVSERVEGHRLSKAFLAEGRPVVLTLTFGGGAVQAKLEGPGAEAARPFLSRLVLRLLGLGTDPAPFEAAHPELARGREGLRIPLTLDPFEALVWAILGQQVNLAFAFALRRDLIRLAGLPAPEELLAHPDATRVAALDLAELRSIRLSGRKAEYLLGAAEAVASGRLVFEGLGDAEAAHRALTALHGCGAWTAQYVLMRGLGHPDCVPVGDSALSTALQRWFRLEARPGPAETQQLMAPFAPHRSLATFHLWASLKGTPA